MSARRRDAESPERKPWALGRMGRAAHERELAEAWDSLPRWNATSLFDALRGLFRRNRAARAAEIEGLLPPKAFYQELVKERALSDRTGHAFALMSFKTDGLRQPEKRMAVNRVLASVLAARTRVSDTRGWFGNRVAIILPYTTAVRATAVWHSVHGALLKRLRLEAPELMELATITCEVYTYPSVKS